MGVYEVKFFDTTNSLGATGEKRSDDFIFEAIDKIFWILPMRNIQCFFRFFWMLKILFNKLVKIVQRRRASLDW